MSKQPMPDLGQFVDYVHALKVERDALAAECQRLRSALKEAFEEGFSEGNRQSDDRYHWKGYQRELAESWETSDAKKIAALADSKEGGVMNLYWISWYQPTEDCRPLSFPPNESVLGWWNTGSREDAWTLCAWVRAADDETARAVVVQDWPEAMEWRFCERREILQISDRFPLSDWMRDRIQEPRP